MPEPIYCRWEPSGPTQAIFAFDESKIERADDGKFSSGGGTGKSASKLKSTIATAGRVAGQTAAMGAVGAGTGAAATAGFGTAAMASSAALTGGVGAGATLAGLGLAHVAKKEVDRYRKAIEERKKKGTRTGVFNQPTTAGKGYMLGVPVGATVGGMVGGPVGGAVGAGLGAAAGWAGGATADAAADFVKSFRTPEAKAAKAVKREMRSEHKSAKKALSDMHKAAKKQDQEAIDGAVKRYMYHAAKVASIKKQTEKHQAEV